VTPDGRSLAGRVAVITGSATGIGQTLAFALAQAGADVAGIDISDQAETNRRIREIGATFLALSADITDPSAIKIACERAASEFGKLEIVVANAGIYPSTPFDTVTHEEWRRIMTVNLDGTFLTVQAALPYLKQAGWGRIVVISSATIWIGVPTLVPYVTTKAGLIGFTRALAPEVGGFGITVNAITPGLTETETTLRNSWDQDQFDWVVAGQIVKRRQQPGDLVTALLFLCDPGSDFITGQTINVDGGKAKH
jgi:NAD(P)-dependent dehydrogenase (short-subunit alcohol dehydrogenase family)